MSHSEGTSSADDAAFGRLAKRMSAFHEHFRQDWTTLYSICVSGSRPQGMTLRGYIQLGLQFCSQLEVHHNIEESWFFPLLAERMPCFRPGDELIGQHRQIHEGLEQLQTYLEACRRGESELRLVKVKEILDSFREVLWKHLDQEVEDLGAENMRKYWTREEIDRFPA
ncbi:DNA polymerase kappa [Paramyrothecium foliicola]|nr:DNA polymerase kappa [Paramyrothecium foliicola]